MTQYPSTAARISGIITTDATWTPINIGYEVPEGSVSKIDMKIIASDYGNNHATWILSAVVRRFIGQHPTIVQGNSYSITKLATGATTWDIRLVTDNDLIRLEVLGETGKTIDWLLVGQDPITLYGNPALDAMTDLTNSLISYWTLDEVSTGAAPVTRNDSFGTNHLTDNNTTASAAGKISDAGSFVAINSEYLSCASNASLQTGDIDFTVSAWVNYTDLVGGKILLSKWNALGEWRLGSLGTGSSFDFIVGDGATSAAVTSGTVATAGAWYFVVVWHDSTLNTINIQVNDGATVSAVWTTGLSSTAFDFEIGAQASGITCFNGLIDEVGFWKRLLTATERTALYNSGVGLSYPF